LYTSNYFREILQLIEEELKPDDDFNSATHGGNKMLKAALHIFKDIIQKKTTL
jgi:type IV secretory pathway VirD2 relaxase